MDNVKIGGNIQFYRKEKKLTQKILAAKIGKTESTIAKYEKGLVEIPLSVLESIAEVLSVSINKLVGGEQFTAQTKLYKTLAFDDYLRSLGYSVGGDTSEGYMWINHDGKSYEVSCEDLKSLENRSEAFTKFILYELLSERRYL